MGMVGQLHAPAALPPGKGALHPFYRRLGGPQGRFGLVRNISPHRDSIPDSPARLSYPDPHRNNMNKTIASSWWPSTCKRVNKTLTYCWFQTFAVIWILYMFLWVFPSTPSLWRWNWHRVPKRRPTTISRPKKHIQN